MAAVLSDNNCAADKQINLFSNRTESKVSRTNLVYETQGSPYAEGCNSTTTGRSSCNKCNTTICRYCFESCFEHSLKQNIWRCINVIIALLFAAAVGFQWNDPDTHWWVIAYIVPCLVSVSITMRPSFQDKWIWKLIVTLHIIGCFSGLLFMAIKYRNKIAKASSDIISIEEGWEICGLAVVIGWLSICLFIASFRSCVKCIRCSRRPSMSPRRQLFDSSLTIEAEYIENNSDTKSRSPEMTVALRAEKDTSGHI